MKEYWIVNGRYAFPTRDLAERFIVFPEPKKIEHCFVVSDETMNWLRPDAQAYFNSQEPSI